MRLARWFADVAWFLWGRIVRRGPMGNSDSYIDSALKKYPPVGRCIYCPRTDSLDTEHIVPYSMGSRWELPRASCPVCADITKKFEQICARDMFGDMRAQWKIYSRKKKDRRARFAKGLANPFNLSNVVTPTTEGPLAPIGIPVYDQPGLLSERPKVIGFTNIEVQIIHPIIGENQGRRVKLAVHIDPYAFARMLAKIAYAASVAEYGIDEVPKDLVPYILGTDQCISHVVGASGHPLPPHPPLVIDANGKLNLEPFRVIFGIWRNNGRQLLVLTVQLFRFLNGPVHWVAVGPANDSLAARVEAPAHSSSL